MRASCALLCAVLATHAAVSCSHTMKGGTSVHVDDDDDDEDDYTKVELILDVVLFCLWIVEDPSKVCERLSLAAALLITLSLLTIVLDLCRVNLRRVPRPGWWTRMGMRCVVLSDIMPRTCN